MRSLIPRSPRSGAPTADTAALVDRLDESRHRFTRHDRAAKWAALSALAGRAIREPRLLIRFHEALCFLRAYSDDAELLQAVESALEKLGARVAALRAAGRVADVEGLDETGIAGTTVRCPLSYPAARWLADRFPELVEIDWDDPDTEAALGPLLPSLIRLANEDVLVEVGVPYRAWVQAAKGDDGRSDLRWILDGLGRGSGDAGAGRALYDARELRLRWELRESWASRTLIKVPGARVFFHRGALVRWRGPVTRRLPGARMPVRLAAPREAQELLDAARAAVIVRYREVHGFNFADPGNVLVADAGRGVQIAWFGLLPAHRLPLRAHYGYLLLKNGVPTGYGDASLLFDWAEIAFNIFESFRRGESAFVFIRLLNFVHQQFGVRAFHLSPYQIGRDNVEAIESGAFWFYYKLGFRPKRRDLARLAVDERRHIARDPAYRSSRETLERFSEDGMFMAIRQDADPASRDFDARRVGLRAAAVAAPGRGRRSAMVAVARRLGTPRWRAWPAPERIAFERLAPILAAIPDLAEWPLEDKRALVALARAKGGPREADYLRRLRAHRRLRKSLLRLGGPDSN